MIHRSPVTRLCHSVAETEAFGASLACLAPKGQVIGLSGDLGAGKTALVRGFARGFGCTSRAHSPTFALLNEYEGGRFRLFHLDLYRLGSPAEIQSAGLEEYLVHPEGVSVVEWMERWTGPDVGTPPSESSVWNVHLEVVDETTRRITHDVPGA